MAYMVTKELQIFMSHRVPHCSNCPYFLDRGYGQPLRRLCTHPDYELKQSRYVRLIHSTYASTSPPACPLRAHSSDKGGDQE